MSTRALTKQESDRVRSVLRSLQDQYGTQVALAQAVGISQQVLSRILKGDPAGLYVAKHVAKLRGITVEQLLTGRVLPELETLVQANRGRWSDEAIAAVRNMRDLSPSLMREEYEALLERVEKALAPVRRDVAKRGR